MKKVLFCSMLLTLLVLIPVLTLQGDQTPKKKYYFGDLGPPEDHELTKRNLKATVPDYPKAVSDLPKAFHWPYTKPKSQQDCGSCWAFASVGVLEYRVMKVSKKYYAFSEQQLINCYKNGHGCNGSNSNSLKFWYSTGPMLEDCTGYTPCACSCRRLNQCNMRLPYYTCDYYTLDTSDLDAMKHSILYDGPAYFAFDVYEDFITYWGTGAPGIVYKYSGTGNKAGRHAVVVYGWNDSIKAWICKNSWGKTGPNKNGTFWISYDDFDELDYHFATVDLSVAVPCPPTHTPAPSPKTAK